MCALYKFIQHFRFDWITRKTDCILLHNAQRINLVESRICLLTGATDCLHFQFDLFMHAYSYLSHAVLYVLFEITKLNW